ncbi:MAG: hypothetical protein ACYC8V_13765 [Caulobacteraceae bacterium]
MKHAGPQALARLAPLLERLRTQGGLKERSLGVFYWKSKPFLHFHEDPAGLFADIRAGDGVGFDRIKVDEPEGRGEVIERIKQVTRG